MVPESDDYSFKAYVIDPSWAFKIKNLVEDGCYKGDVINRSIGYPYSYHSKFRAGLIKLIGREDLLDGDGHIDWNRLPSDIPFYDFINFADNEGCLDWEVSKTIYNDFVLHADDVNDDSTFSNYYNLWLEVFRDATDNNGVVVFS